MHGADFGLTQDRKISSLGLTQNIKSYTICKGDLRLAILYMVVMPKSRS